MKVQFYGGQAHNKENDIPLEHGLLPRSVFTREHSVKINSFHLYSTSTLVADEIKTIEYVLCRDTFGNLVYVLSSLLEHFEREQFLLNPAGSASTYVSYSPTNCMKDLADRNPEIVLQKIQNKAKRIK